MQTSWSNTLGDADPPKQKCLHGNSMQLMSVLLVCVYVCRGVRVDVWSQLRDVHNAFGLKHQWGGSHSNKMLLCSLGIDTRNIVSLSLRSCFRDTRGSVRKFCCWWLGTLLDWIDEKNSAHTSTLSTNSGEMGELILPHRWHASSEMWLEAQLNSNACSSPVSCSFHSCSPVRRSSQSLCPCMQPVWWVTTAAFRHFISRDGKVQECTDLVSSWFHSSVQCLFEVLCQKHTVLLTCCVSCSTHLGIVLAQKSKTYIFSS